jgi:hypothetical protein
VLTSILTSEVTDIPPKPQSELGNMVGTQSGTWGNLVQHMCKSQQTTSVKAMSMYICTKCNCMKCNLLLLGKLQTR